MPQLVAVKLPSTISIPFIRKAIAILALAMIEGFHQSVSAQIIPDRSLPQNSTVQIRDNRAEINGGTVRGTNLFHSFAAFSFDGSQIDTAYFNNSNDIEQIISRVTGSSLSYINGLIKANATADLFLINPNGIIFGRDAALNLGGSFVASTAESLHFKDNTTISTVHTPVSPVLTISIPLGLQYGTQPGDISVLANNLTVPTGKTLALFGGNIALEGGMLTAPEGNIYLGSASDRQTIELSATTQGWRPHYTALNHLDRFGDIELAQAASLDVSGNGAGNIQLQGNYVGIKEGGQIILNTFGDRAGGSLAINAETIELNDSSISSVVETNAEGNGGQLWLQSERLNLQQKAQIILDTMGAGNGGDLTITAHQVDLSGASEIVARATDDQGKGGDLKIFTENLTLQDNAKIYAGNFASSIAIEPANPETNNLLLLNSNTNVSNKSLTYSIIGMGEVGKIHIDARQIALKDASSITTATFDRGGGDMEINAEQITVRDLAAIATETRGNSMGGRIDLATDTIELTDEAQINTYSFATGESGKIALNSNQLDSTPTTFGTASEDFGGLARQTHLFSMSWLEVAPELIVSSCIFTPNDFKLTQKSQWRQSLIANNFANRNRLASPNLTSLNLARSVTDDLIEAQNWIVNANGKIELLTAPSVRCFD